MELRFVKLDYNSKLVRVLAKRDRIEWVCVHDLSIVIKRPHLMKTNPLFSICPSYTRMVFGDRDLNAIKPRDISKLLKLVENENKTINASCKSILEFFGKYTENVGGAKIHKGDIDENMAGSEYPPNLPAIVGHNGTEGKVVMSSLEIAAFTGKEHKYILKSIRTMEEEWQKVSGEAFQLSNYTDMSGKSVPCYLLSKPQALYVGSKYNNEIRARIIIRLEELENQLKPNRFIAPTNMREALELALQQQIQIEEQSQMIGTLKGDVNRMEPKEAYYDHVICEREYFPTATIAAELGMSYPKLTTKLRELNVITSESGLGVRAIHPYEHWMTKVSPENCKGTYRQWTKEGRDGIIQLINPKMPI